MKRHPLTLVLAGLLILSGVGLALAPNPNPGVIPNNEQPEHVERRVVAVGVPFDAADVPFLNTGGPVDISAHQSGHVWFLAGANNGLTEPRTGEVPTGTSLFPLANLVNDYPCPPEFEFEPPPRRDAGALSPEDRK